MNFALCTLGCKLNQLEGEGIADSFRKAGFALSSQNADIIIINTCTVTSKADQKCRRVIRKALRDNPDSCVIVTGCYAQLDAEEIAALEDEGEGRLFITVGGEGGSAVGSAGTAKSALLELPEYLCEMLARSPDSALPDIVAAWMNRVGGGEAKGSQAPGAFSFKPEEYAFHSRGYLKIQDGCNNRCSYCRVRLARGSSVSLPKESALAAVRAAEERGLPELMITGVNITQYRHNGADIAALLEYLLEGTSSIAFRLSSLEPDAINEKLAAVLAHPRIRPHFHLCVQSGSDSVLRAMGRAYTAQTVKQAAALLRGVKENPFLACDIIAGFPGETGFDFHMTLELCVQTGFAWIHAFPYSKRAGTAAFSLANPVCERLITQRVEALNTLALHGRRHYAQSWLNRELSAVVEKGNGSLELRLPGQCRAVSENYLKLIVNGCDVPPGSVIRCTPVSLCDDADGEKPDAVAVIVGN